MDALWVAGWERASGSIGKGRGGLVEGLGGPIVARLGPILPKGDLISLCALGSEMVR